MKWLENFSENGLSPFIVDRRYDLIRFKAENKRSAEQLETAMHIYIRRAMSTLKLYDNTALTLTQWRQLRRFRLVSCQWRWVTQLLAIINFATWHCRPLELSPLGSVPSGNYGPGVVRYLQTQPSALYCQKPEAQRSQLRPTTPGLQRHWPDVSTHCRLSEASWQSHALQPCYRRPFCISF